MTFETNDDPLMLFIASGALTGTPDEHLQCIHLGIGMLLKLLYGTWPGLPWYGILLTSVHLISLLAILFAVAYKRDLRPVDLLLFVLIVLLGYEALFLVKMQFTATAFIAGAAALFSLLGRYHPPVRLSLFLAFLFLAFLLRRETFLPLSAFAALIFLFLYADRQLSGRQIAGTAMVALLVYLGAAYLNDRDPDYQRAGYYPYHRATDIICNMPLDTTGNRVASYGWTPNDLALLGFWYWSDAKVFAADKVTGFAREAQTYRNIPDTIVFGLNVLKEEQFAILPLLLAAVFVALWVPGTAQRRFVFLAVLLTAALLLYLIVTARVPKRVSTPILFLATALTLFTILNSQAKALYRTALLGLLFLLCAYKFKLVWSLSQDKAQSPPVFARSVAHMNAHPEDVFIVVSKGLPLDLMPVFQRTENLVPARNLIFTGWLTHLPAYDDLLAANGLQDLTRDIIGRKDVVLVNGNIRLREILSEYYRSHYGTEPRFEPYTPAFPDIPAYRIVFP